MRGTQGVRRNRGFALGGAAAFALVAFSSAALLVGASGKPARWSSDSKLSEPVLVHKVVPSYPEPAREKGISGVVRLDTVIGEDGTVHTLRAVNEVDPDLARAAIAAVRHWVFEPARTKDGRAVEVLYTITVAFKLDGDGGSTPKN